VASSLVNYVSLNLYATIVGIIGSESKDSRVLSSTRERVEASILVLKLVVIIVGFVI
jgi:hypothetical protein